MKKWETTKVRLQTTKADPYATNAAIETTKAHPKTTKAVFFIHQQVQEIQKSALIVEAGTTYNHNTQRLVQS
ncbi:hypothetical protein [Sporosarcina sp. 6E9]|uniref:hypothetical protein n=1 Tax=Sporosarcina sp. 6E9 TaxID=2819235 RepID=UPI001B309E50|nr:hypothetical protein [Sporosarcina sp. 6E9]